MGNLEDIWEFWRPFVFAAMALVLLALTTMGIVSHKKDAQRDYVKSLGNESVVGEEHPSEVKMDMVVASARSEALANLNEIR